MRLLEIQLGYNLESSALLSVPNLSLLRRKSNRGVQPTAEDKNL